MIGADIETGRNIALADSHAPAQQTATGRLQNRGVDCRVPQNHLGGHGAGHIAVDGQGPVNIDTVGTREANGIPGQLHDVRQHP